MFAVTIIMVVVVEVIVVVVELVVVLVVAVAVVVVEVGLSSLIMRVCMREHGAIGWEDGMVG